MWFHKTANIELHANLAVMKSHDYDMQVDMRQIEVSKHGALHDRKVRSDCLTLKSYQNGKNLIATIHKISKIFY